jgi:hypothetical protein
MALLLTGCFGETLASTKNPICSWNSQVPSNAQQLCTSTYKTLNGVAQAEVKGNSGEIRRLVVRRSVAQRIARFGAKIRARRIIWMHVVPSYTLTVIHPGLIGARFYLVGQEKNANIKSAEAIFLRVRDGKARIMYDFPEQDW